MSVYTLPTEAFLEQIFCTAEENPDQELHCAGFELQEWRCTQLANYLISWLPDYGLAEEELQFDHVNAYEKLRQAAARVYTSEKYKDRGEAGEIALHAICRNHFKTIPISPRVFYKSSSNDVIKSFDMVHARFPGESKFEIWLGESKLFKDRDDALSEAIQSIKKHIDQGFLTNQKLLIGPQIPKSVPHHDEIRELFKSGVSLDKLLSTAVFVVGILANSDAIQPAKSSDQEYRSKVKLELSKLAAKLANSGLCATLKLVLIYVPLKDKNLLVEAFDKKLKGLQ
jgi:hypothetical protein